MSRSGTHRSDEDDSRPMPDASPKASSASRPRTDTARLTHLDLVLERLQAVLPYDSASILLRHGDADLRIAAGRGYSLSADAFSTRFDSRRIRRFHALLTQGVPTRIADVHEWPDWVEIPGTEAIRAWIGVPMLVDGRVIGVLSVDRNTPNAFSEDDLKRVMAFAGKISGTIRQKTESAPGSSPARSVPAPSRAPLPAAKPAPVPKTLGEGLDLKALGLVGEGSGPGAARRHASPPKPRSSESSPARPALEWPVVFAIVLLLAIGVGILWKVRGPGEDESTRRDEIEKTRAEFAAFPKSAPVPPMVTPPRSSTAEPVAVESASNQAPVPEPFDAAMELGRAAGAFPSGSSASLDIVARIQPAPDGVDLIVYGRGAFPDETPVALLARHQGDVAASAAECTHFTSGYFVGRVRLGGPDMPVPGGLYTLEAAVPAEGASPIALGGGREGLSEGRGARETARWIARRTLVVGAGDSAGGEAGLRAALGDLVACTLSEADALLDEIRFFTRRPATEGPAPKSRLGWLEGWTKRVHALGTLDGDLRARLTDHGADLPRQLDDYLTIAERCGRRRLAAWFEAAGLPVPGECRADSAKSPDDVDQDRMKLRKKIETSLLR